MTHENGKQHPTTRRFEIVISAIVGPIVVALMFGVWGVSVRTRSTEQTLDTVLDNKLIYEGRVMRRFGEMEGRLQNAETVEEELGRLRTRVDADEHLWDVIVADNRDDHEEIKDTMRANRAEVMKTLSEMKTDLIREFHKGNGDAH